MARTVKCPICSTQNQKENTIQYKTKYYCKSCYDNELQDQIEQAQQYKDLIDYICKLFDIKAPTMTIVAQIKRFKEEHNYSYIGMKTTLHYFYELEENNVEDAQGIGIIPYIYDEAKAFYVKNKERNDKLEEVDLDSIQENIVINIDSQKIKKDDDYKSLVLIDIERIEED